MPVVPVVMRSFASWLTASLFLSLKPSSSACAFSFKIWALASESCARKSSVDVGTALATLDAAAPRVDRASDEEALLDESILLVGAERVWGVTASGAGEPKEGEGDP